MTYTKEKWKFNKTNNLIFVEGKNYYSIAQVLKPTTNCPEQANGERIVQCVNNFDDLLEACKEAQRRVYEAINKRGADLPQLWHELQDAISKAGEK